MSQDASGEGEASKEISAIIAYYVLGERKGTDCMAGTEKDCRFEEWGG